MAAKYPPARPGERFRWLDFPTERPAPAPATSKPATRRDGTPCDVRRTLGLAPAADPGADDDQGVHDWRPVR